MAEGESGLSGVTHACSCYRCECDLQRRSGDEQSMLGVEGANDAREKTVLVLDAVSLVNVAGKRREKGRTRKGAISEQREREREGVEGRHTAGLRDVACGACLTDM